MSRESAYAERNGIVRIKPGDPAASEVWLRISSQDPEEVMPPPDAHTKLSEAQKQKIKAWIEQGAKYAPHWSLVVPTKVGSAGFRRSSEYRPSDGSTSAGAAASVRRGVLLAHSRFRRQRRSDRRVRSGQLAEQV
jgi:hypothetical protein